MSTNKFNPQAPPGFKLIQTLKGHRTKISRVAWSPDGRKIATPSHDKSIRIWDCTSGTVLQKLEDHAAFVTGVTWASDGARIASSSDDKTVRIWDTQTGKSLVEPLQHPAIVTGVTWAPNQPRVASSCDDELVRIWDVDTGELLNTLKGHTDRVLSVAWSPAGDMIASASWDGSVVLWDGETGQLLRRTPSEKNKLFHVAWANNGQIASAGFEGSISVWDSKTGERLGVVDQDQLTIFGISFSPDGKFLATKAEDRTLRVWNCADWRSASLETSALWPYSCVAFHPSEPILATTSDNDKVVQLWKLDFDVIFRNRVSAHHVHDPRKNLNVLHLSDVHIGKSNPTQHTVQLTSDLMTRLQIDRLHYLVVSGDFTDRAGKNEYDSAAQLIDAIARRFSVPCDHIILAPGNHDVDWPSAAKAYQYVYNGGAKSESSSNCIELGDLGVLARREDLYKRRFSNFAHFYEKLCGKSYPAEYDEQAMLHVFEQDRILFVTLNSSWNIDFHYKNRYSVNMDALSKVLQQLMDRKYDGWLKIAVWHHPVSGDTPMNADFLQQLTINSFSIAMHGHIHEAIEQYHKYDSRHGLQIIGAGTFGAPADQWVPGIPLSYNVLVINPEPGMATVHTRKKVQPKGAWDAYAVWGDRNKPDPYYSFELNNWIGPLSPTNPPVKN